MIGPYIQAVEKQLEWVRNLEQDPGLEEGARQAWADTYLKMGTTMNEMDGERLRLARQLAHSDTLFMNRQFCEMTDHASSLAPDDLRFEIPWLQTMRGFLFRESPIKLIDEHYAPINGKFGFDGTFQCMCWEMRTLNVLIVRWFTKLEGDERIQDALILKEVHLYDQECLGDALRRKMFTEGDKPIIKWLYSAFHLMAQRVTTVVKQKVDRAVRRRAEKAGEVAPEIVKVITLRRMEEDRQREAPTQINWQWRWMVRGHWRQQFYPSENTHKPVFIEAYLKGPEDKPLKDPGVKLFAAVR